MNPTPGLSSSRHGPPISRVCSALLPLPRVDELMRAQAAGDDAAPPFFVSRLTHSSGGHVSHFDSPPITNSRT
jgi:hypothetical protein